MLHERIKELREENRYKQKDIANAIHTSRQAYSHYENGTRKITAETLISLADFYEMSLDELVGRTLKK